jgi:cAMP-dependent protein kinase regulator
MEETESVATLMARRDYGRALPLLRRDLEKYPTNLRIRLQFADALAGAGEFEEALEQYDQTASFYEENGLVVQAIAIRKKSDRIRGERSGAAAPGIVTAEEQPPRPAPKSPLFEDMTAAERDAVVGQMVLEQFNEGDIVITEGEAGSSLYVIVSGEVKVYTRGAKGESFFLARLGEGDFFGEVSVLTGKPRTATITAAQRTELLRLDKEKLDQIVPNFPRVKEILDEFYRRRASHTVEAMIEDLKSKR